MKCGSHPHLISYPGFVSALSWRHNRAQRCHGEKCQIKAKGFNREAAVMPCTSLPRRYDMAQDEFQGRMAGDQSCADHLGLVSAVTVTFIHLPSIHLLLTPRRPDEGTLGVGEGRCSQQLGIHSGRVTGPSQGLPRTSHQLLQIKIMSNVKRREQQG